MNTDPTPLRTFPDDAQATPNTTGAPTADEALSDTAAFVSKAPAENLVDGQITEGVPVFDAHGETIGNVAAYDETAGRVVVRAGWLFAQDTPLPLAAIADQGASGLYLRQSKEELARQYGGAQTSAAATSQERSAPSLTEPPARTSSVPDTAAGEEVGGVTAESSDRPTLVFTATAPPDQDRGWAPTAAAGSAGPVSDVTDPLPAQPTSAGPEGRVAAARSAGAGRTTQTLTTYLGDLHALESHILHALDKQVRLLPDHPDVRARLRVYRNTLEEHLDALEARLTELGGSPTHPLKEAVSALVGVAAGLYDKVRTEEASKDLRDDYTALNHALIATAMLHTTALALEDQETAALCARHLRDHARFVMEINQGMPALVVAELRQDGLPVAEDALEAARQTLHAVWQQPPHTA